MAKENTTTESVVNTKNDYIIDSNFLSSSIAIQETHQNKDSLHLSGYILYFESNKKFTFVCNVCKTRKFKRLKEFFKHFKKCYDTKEKTQATNIVVNEMDSNKSEDVLDVVNDDINAQIEIVNYAENYSQCSSHKEENSIKIAAYELFEIDEPSRISEEENNDITNCSNEIIFHNELSPGSSRNSSKILVKKENINESIENEHDSLNDRKKRKTMNDSYNEHHNIKNEIQIYATSNNIDSTLDENYIQLNNDKCEVHLKNNLKINLNSSLLDILEDVDNKWAIVEKELNNSFVEENEVISDQTTFLNCKTEINYSIQNHIKYSNDETFHFTSDSSDNSNSNASNNKPLNIIDNCEIVVQHNNSEFEDFPSYNVVCEKCHGNFNTIGELKKHRKIINSLNPGVFECDLSYANKLNCIDGVNILKPSSYTCLYCNKKYLKEEHLDEHKRISHNKETPYNCIYCSKKFVTEIGRRNHENLHLKKKN